MYSSAVNPAHGSETASSAPHTRNRTTHTFRLHRVIDVQPTQPADHARGFIRRQSAHHNLKVVHVDDTREQRDHQLHAVRAEVFGTRHRAELLKDHTQQFQVPGVDVVVFECIHQ
jgi:hypothetical protein